MRLSLPKLFVLPLALAWLSCDQDLNSAKDQPLVDYVLIVTDSTTSLPVDSVRVRVTTITGDTSTFFTNAQEGRVQLPSLASSRTVFELSRPGYNTRDSIDTVDAPVDSVFHRPVARLVRIKMTRLGSASLGRVQVNILPRAPNLAKLKRGTVAFDDSSGERRVVADTGETGVIGISGLKIGKTMVLVTHPGYLGHWFEVTVDTARIQSQVATLVSLGDNRISGQVFSATASGSTALPGAKVAFVLKDSLAVPDTFTAFTLPLPDDAGRFILDSVPALDGRILYYKDRTSKEAVKAVPILKEEVLQDGPLPAVILTLNPDSSRPYLKERPKDSVNAGDSLLFRFNQKAGMVEGFLVRLINQSQLLVDTAWSKDGTQLKVWQKDAKWIRGKTYEYSLTLRNEAGQYFTARGDSQKVLKGIFSVRDSAGTDSALLLPRRIALAYFNSGGYHQFSEADTNSSPKADSTSQFARLKWGWDAGTGHKADSLLLYYKDGGITAYNWSLWGAVPGFSDSATLNFSDHYSTSRNPNLNKPIPFKIPGGRIDFRIIPKHDGKTYPDTILDAVEQGMGPAVYVKFTPENNPFKTGLNAVDSLKVEYRTSDGTSFDFGAGAPVPNLYFNKVKVDTTLAVWRWTTTGRIGRIVYKLPGFVPTATGIRADLNGVPFQGKPIWHRNRELEFVLP